ncbi:MAG: multicopper oxidase domain-containing protein [Saprospiraceae bacterium]|nr:multicopper oxidase domain-containing protein [Saprospiraceae bacterium]MCF8249993.1 multicopper oxidase domain-containing protein [Saprospiraceae bacterium]MCF8278967.1 multicopper oxidase domain-containing protein [Bacteroidales bacterium]MCF8311006.1 multicopper oxidase domain-containing protein [Saprospiraceae bacterium]MCF8439658.1 multicopper oxidase domain-containing protein [Saprospiraceae bacterium]
MLSLLLGAFLFFGANEAVASVNLTVHNTGCQDMKVYKKNSNSESYQTTIFSGDNWNISTSNNQEFVFRKTNGTYISNYVCTNSNNQNHNCDSGGCNGGGNCDNQLAHWNLNACSAGSSYSEFTPNITTATGFSSISASIFSNLGDHSCNYGQSGEGMCHVIKDGCSWSNNDNNAYKFSVTIKPTTGNSVTLSKLTFYESAPSSYSWVGGGSGDNDPPSKYGVRVTKNGTEVFKQIDISTTSAWSLETIDFSADPDFTVPAQTTFDVEILGYCRQGSNGYAVWDVDEIKVYGCAADPCAAQGGDSDGDGVCNNQDCAPNNASLPATPGTACNDGNPNTSNDSIQSDGCTCAGTPSGPNCTTDINITTGNGTILVTGLGAAPVSSLQVFSSTWQPIYSCFANCGASQTVPVPAGNYYVYAKYYTAGYQLICEKQLTVTVTGSNPCANQGGDSDGDGVCNNQDCQPNNPAFPATPGTPCNDGNPNTINDVVQAGGCSCAGTPVSSCDNVTNGGTIGFGNNCAATTTVCNTAAPNITNCSAPSGGSGNLEIIWLKSTTSCSAPTTSAADIIAGLDPHWSLISGQTGLTYNPGTVSASTCYLRCSRRAGCSSYVESNILSLTVDCGGGGTPNCANLAYTTGAGSITVTGLDGAPVTSLQVFSSTWQPIYSCFANCGASQTVSVPAGTYYVYGKYYSAGYAFICEKQQTVTVGGTSPCANQGGDSDGDGVCNNQDCQPYNPAYPAIPGTACNDGNPNTINDVIQTGGCSCAGTPIVTGTLAPSNLHPKFVNQLPAIPRINATGGGTYNIGMEEGSHYLGLFDTNGNPMNTTTWGYSYNGSKMYLGPTFIAQKNVPVDVKWINNLPMTHLLPMDESIHKARPNAGVPTVVHLHGGHVESASDGYPEAWFTQNWAEKGGEFKKQTYHYTNDQEAAPLWYHDHTLGITRLNVYAGLAGMYLLRDNNELSLNLPTGNYERELVIQDKQFSSDGSMYFPALLSDPEAADFPTNPAIEPTIFPEFFGDYILVNGAAWPKLDVQPTKYRFRLLNASDSRFYIFKLSNNANFQQIGTEGGLLNNPVTLNQLVMGPGERYDIVIDFSTMIGQSVVLQNIGPDEPFMGLAAGQIPADPATTGQIMQFKVGNSSTASFTIPNTLRQPIQYLGAASKTRQLLLLEGMDEFGRLQPSLGTAAAGSLRWMDPTTETPMINETEIWEVYNNTGDAHPIHIHQISFQLLNRQEFTGDLDPVTSQLTNIQMVGAPIAPPASEQGWKDTYIVPPGHVARFKVRFDIPGKFVWHCHILSHEDHDMMRPFEVMPAGGGGGTPNCGNVAISTGAGTINVSGLDGAPVTQLQIFTSSWQPYFSCFAGCGASKSVNASPGTYYVKVKYFSATYQQLCEVNQTVTVSQWLAGTADEVFQLYVNKQLEHTEVNWVHNVGYLVGQYELERSLDGSLFKPLASELSKGSHAPELYSNFDLEPAVGDNYYRVKATLLDGTVGYSEAKMVHFDDLTDYTLFPNPANDFVEINLEKVVGAENVNIQVFNNLGLLVKRYDLDEVSSKYYQMDIRELHEGHYIVWLNVPGKRSMAKQLMVGKL